MPIIESILKGAAALYLIHVPLAAPGLALHAFTGGEVRLARSRSPRSVAAIPRAAVAVLAGVNVDLR